MNSQGIRSFTQESQCEKKLVELLFNFKWKYLFCDNETLSLFMTELANQRIQHVKILNKYHVVFKVILKNLSFSHAVAH